MCIGTDSWRSIWCRLFSTWRTVSKSCHIPKPKKRICKQAPPPSSLPPRSTTYVSQRISHDYSDAILVNFSYLHPTDVALGSASHVSKWFTTHSIRTAYCHHVRNLIFRTKILDQLDLCAWSSEALRTVYYRDAGCIAEKK